MDPRLLVIGAFASTLPLLAQPTITSFGYHPNPGQSVPAYHTDTWEDPGATGINVTWDHSSWPVGSNGAITHSDPASGPGNSYFPNATYYTGPVSNEYDYVSWSQDSISSWGWYANDGSDSRSVDTDPLTQLPLPCTMGTTWTDTGSGMQFTLDGPSAFTETVSGQATGWGVFILPDVQYNLVLRVDREEMHSTSTLSGDLLFKRTFTSFYDPITQFSIAEYELDSLSLNGGAFGFISGGVTWLNLLGTGVGEPGGPAADVRAFPDPAYDQLSVSCSLPSGHDATLTLLDGSGRIVVRHRLMPTSTDGVRDGFDVRSLDSGLYTLMLLDDTGRSSSTRVAVVH